MYQGRPQGVSGLTAAVSWPAKEWGRDPAGFAVMRPGVGKAAGSSRTTMQSEA